MSESEHIPIDSPTPPKMEVDEVTQPRKRKQSKNDIADRNNRRDEKERKATIEKKKKKHQQPGGSTSVDESGVYVGSLLSKLVTHKDVVTESFLKEVIDTLPERHDLSATELSRLWRDEARKRITQFSVTLSHKLTPLVQIMLDQKLSSNMEDTFVQVETEQPSLYDMAMRYQRCFDTWIDDENCVSYKATNTKLLGNLDVKDMYVLTFFTFCTCRRSRNDNLLQLGIVGCSTSGKSTLFEAALMEGSHITTNESGVGRFQVGDKPLLLFHDVEIRSLVMSKDTEKIKTIARTEPTVTKIHSSTYTLKPLFVFYSSNERMMTHRFRDSLPNQPFQWRIYHGQVNECTGPGGKKRASEENLTAVQNRFIEAFVRKPPKLDVKDLPRSGGFQRVHGILGMYLRVVVTMEKYDKDDFYSPVLQQYVLHGLCSKFQEFVNVMDQESPGVSRAQHLNGRLRSLIEKHIHPSLQQSLLRFL